MQMLIGCRIALRRWMQKDPEVSWREHVRRVRTLEKWIRQHARHDPLKKSGSVVVILLSYLRPQNIDAIVRVLLATPSVARVIVSNNNPRFRMSQWIAARSDRLMVIEQSKPARCNMRERLAREFRIHKFFLFVDDDIFLTSDQVENLIGHLTRQPDCVHGIFGQEWPGGQIIEGINRVDRPVDVLNRVYACTAEHIEMFFRLAAEAERDEPDIWERNAWDDIVLSLSGSGPPLVHNVGSFCDCPTSGSVRVANWRQPGFRESRAVFFQKMRALRDSLSQEQ